MSAILVFVGGKMMVSELVGKIPVGLSLGVVVAILAISIIASLRFPRKDVAPTAEA